MEENADFLLYIGLAYIVGSIYYVFGILTIEINLIFSLNLSVILVSLGQLFKSLFTRFRSNIFNAIAVICMLVMPFSSLVQDASLDRLETVTTFLTIFSFGLVFMLLYYNNYQIERYYKLIDDLKKIVDKPNYNLSDFEKEVEAKQKLLEESEQKLNELHNEIEDIKKEMENIESKQSSDAITEETVDHEKARQD